jgi:hypothetical protein
VASPLVSVRQRQESRTTITFQKVGLSHWVTHDQYHCPICPMVYFKGNLIIVKHHDHCFSAFRQWIVMPYVFYLLKNTNLLAIKLMLFWAVLVMSTWSAHKFLNLFCCEIVN